MTSLVPVWQCGQFELKFDLPAIMAIINVTPDSFSGDGLSGSIEASLRQAELALSNGARILDVGGESSRPGSESVSVEQELERVIPVVEALVQLGAPVSVDTVKPEVMCAAIAAGATIINDINALRAPGAIDVVAASDAGVCLMHMQGQPRSMQQAPSYDDVVAEVDAFLLERCAALESAGVRRSRVALDPGFGFGKSLEHNLRLFRGMPLVNAHGYPLLVGVSRKTMLGAVTGRAVNERMPASIVTAVLAAQRGASILRVHDVAATRDALAMWAAIEHDRLNAY
ncbi:dihydropteroate synthase [Uliginosibacterium sp. 31-16]|uniref:dihydropteroate synthase n=1 Tax=Uliginosibacterium sp. 31-16 TaxID=3068315 RepID=UPI00273EEAA8|nr:dihydropteroate synthase [Uliginosibacterium sp. 31-16]MDP5240025.1 dihydropteroate synthase [Uliginosibacterium sp. 31-16]